MKKLSICLLLCFVMISSLVLCGCSNNTEEAETALKFYFSALKGFNVNAMEENVKGDSDGDIGFEIEELSDDFRQSDTYKKRIEDMMRSLSSTFAFTINSNEAGEGDCVKFNVTVKCSDVNQADLNAFMQERVDKYLIKHPEAYDMDSYEYEETMIGVQADAYGVFLEKQPRLSKDFVITVEKIDDKWKLATASNAEFFAFLQDTYGNDEEPEVVEEVSEEVTEE